ncbi:alkylresorcinol/alkylpyrone synthase [Nitrospirillum amazonense]|uniref:Alkylresorcinol/alkylpyrone synthase n=1 Tax=Nitrospirillum amazonense TaxID=28077 RepID=A0A560FK29_9PROT|nr:type III polyketide synthase [Nitrospirillum amazonense]TWB21960.1 alkylresorcinol/alkylpyrone synthase [Nitrospirillum amazonense]
MTMASGTSGPNTPAATPPAPARLVSIATALPPYRLTQEQALAGARQVFAHRLRDFDRLAPVFTHAGIEGRASCVPLDWYLEPHGWAERNALYLEHAVDVLARAATQALEQAGLKPTDVDAIVAVSSTGIATPSLDALIMQRLGMRPDVERMPLFGLGCAGGVLGLARAATWATARPGANVLLLVVELCALSFRRGDLSKANVIATALFGDGGAAAILRADPAGRDADHEGRPAFLASAEHRWPDSLGIMGWQVEDDGMGVIFAQSIPTLVREKLPEVVAGFLDRQRMTLSDLAGTICHPGGTKVLDALEEVLAPATDGLAYARDVLRQHGNMSAATVLFVLERRVRQGARGLHLLSALGPGFVAALGLMRL